MREIYGRAMCGLLKETSMTCDFKWERSLTLLILSKALEKNVTPFIWGLQTTLESEARRLIKCLLSVPHLLIAQVM